VPIPTVHEFVVDEVGDTTAQKFQGKFALKTVLTHKEQLRRDELRRLYLGSFTQSANPSPRAANQAELFSEINARITGDKGSAPSWWTDADGGLELSDDNIVLAITTELNKGIAERQKLVQDAIKAARGELKATLQVPTVP
jgi:uncharacterized protein YnzC (UPF0291/DUF896 family)